LHQAVESDAAGIVHQITTVHAGQAPGEAQTPTLTRSGMPFARLQSLLR
jgi:hypothetical protein